MPGCQKHEGNSASVLAQGRGDQKNDKARKVKPEAARKGAPSAELPNLEQLKQRPHQEPEAPPAIPSAIRLHRKPTGSRNGKKVGDPGTTGGPVSSTQPGARPSPSGLRSHHGRSKTMTVAPAPTGDEQFLQNFFYWALLRYPNGTELQYWEDILRSAFYQGQSSLVFSGRELGMTLFESAEYAARTDRQGNNWQANHNYVHDLYRAYLMRDPAQEQGGWDFWTSVVASAGRENVRHAFDECGEFAGIVGAVTPNGGISSAVSSLSTARVDPNNQPGNQLIPIIWTIPLIR